MSRREVTVHRTGTDAPHFDTVERFRDYLNAVLEAHVPTEAYPVARLKFPGGWFVTLTTNPGEEAPQP